MHDDRYTRQWGPRPATMHYYNRPPMSGSRFSIPVGVLFSPSKGSCQSHIALEGKRLIRITAHQVVSLTSCSLNCFAHIIEGIGRSGLICRTSRSALTVQTPYATASIPANVIAVLVFQLAGRDHQPPAGDHTCFGYG